MIQMSVKGLDKTLSDLENQLSRQERTHLRVESYRLLDALKRATPKDTGEAAGGWKIVSRLRGFDIYNDVPYLPLLNAGSSQQAPKYFIERTALRYGRPRGLLVVEN